MKRTFQVTMSYELHPTTLPEARKLLRAELVGRKWNDRHKAALTPSNTVWGTRTMGEDDTTDEVQAASLKDLRDAAAAVARTGRAIKVVRAWLHISGGGWMGLAAPEALDFEAG
jgi:hypothetical protein